PGSQPRVWDRGRLGRAPARGKPPVVRDRPAEAVVRVGGLRHPAPTHPMPPPGREDAVVAVSVVLIVAKEEDRVPPLPIRPRKPRRGGQRVEERGEVPIRNVGAAVVQVVVVVPPDVDERGGW